MLRKLPRVVLNVLTVLSLALCLAACVLWVRSYWVTDAFGWDYWRRPPDPAAHDDGEQALAGVVSARGALWLGWKKFSGDDIYGGDEDPRAYWQADERFMLAGTPGWLTFAVESDENMFETVRGVLVPHWVAAALFSAAPICRAYHQGRVRRRARRGHCACGYDLRASPGRCPECGTIPART